MAIRVVLLNNMNMYHASLEDGNEVSFGTGKKDDIFVEGYLEEQVVVVYRKGHLFVHAMKGFGVDQQIDLDDIVILSKELRVMIFATEETLEQPTEIRLPYSCNIKFGRRDSNDITLKFPFVSGEHFILRNENGITRVEDLGSTNGIFLNNKKVDIARMKSGDVLSIMSIEIRLFNGTLYIDNVGENIRVNNVSDSASRSFENHADFTESKLIYKRSPRAQEKLPSEDILLASAPNKAQKYEKGRGMFSSLAGSGAMFASSFITGITSPALLAARAASLVSPIAGATSTGGNSRKKKKEYAKYEQMREEKYGAYIVDQKARIGKVADLQRDIIMHENPDPVDCVSIVTGLTRRLWERSLGDRDFLDVRVGMGYEDLCVEVKARQDQSTFEIEDDEVKELTDQIIEETRIVDNVPSRVSLLNNTSIGIVGDRQKAIHTMKNMIVSLCTLHCYEDVRLVGIFDDKESSEWEVLRWLPHFTDPNGQQNMLSFDRERAHDLCEELSDMIKTRMEDSRMTDRNNVTTPLPYYIIIFGSKNMVEQEEIMNHLFTENPAIGLTSIFLFDDLYNLPHRCRFILDTNNGPCVYDNAEANKKFFYTPDQRLSDRDFDMFARRMSAINLAGFSRKAEMPNSITFLKGYGVDKVSELEVATRWSKCMPYISLGAQIGMMAGEKTFFLDIHEKAHGPHGLVAGTTGSGKSEILQTWILSMAVNFHPHYVSFVLIDYKGGGMANLLEPLPHVVGKITNIGSNIGRSLLSLQSEIKRRQQLFDQAGVNHIDKYQKLYRNGEVIEPMPHLIIVADEFAELKKEEPEFMAGLISASRVGRSLGIHLVLATQKPGGIVDDQIQSNSRFRLCLKVQDVNDSREMIKRPDAARLTRPGRAFVRVGEDEYFDLFQSYWSGAEYSEDTEKVEEVPEVELVNQYGGRISLEPPKKKAKKSDMDELTAIVNHICEVAKQRGIEQLQGPWLPELPEALSLEELQGNRTGLKWPSLPIGRFDEPKFQRQGTQYIDFSEQGHYAIYGASGTGKTTLLKTILLGICRFYKPNEISAYIIDAGGWSLSAFAGMPNIGGVALDGEEEKIDKLQKMIMSEFENRKRKFLKNSVSSLKAYRQDVSDEMPAIVIVVDNIVPLFDLYPDIENFFISIARDGATYGIYLVYTASSTSGVRYKIVQNTRGAVTFEMTDKGDYSTIVGRPEGTLPKILGRAFIKNNPPVEFQAALPFIASSDKAVNDKIKEEAMALSSSWSGYLPMPIPVMSDVVSIEDISKSFGKRTQIPLGVSYETIMPVGIDLAEQYSMLVVGPIKSGKSSFLAKTAKVLCRKDADTELIVFDSHAASLHTLEETAYQYAQVSDEERVTAILSGIVAKLNERKTAEKQGSSAEDFNQICIVIDDLKDLVDSISNENKNTLERICRMAGGLAVIVIAAGRMSDMEKYSEIESLTRVIISNQNGLVMAGSPAQYPYFKNNLKYTEKGIEAGEGNGYAFINGECIKIRKAE